jgi:hypothetical protein
MHFQKLIIYMEFKTDQLLIWMKVHKTELKEILQINLCVAFKKMILMLKANQDLNTEK